LPSSSVRYRPGSSVRPPEERARDPGLQRLGGTPLLPEHAKCSALRVVRIGGCGTPGAVGRRAASKSWCALLVLPSIQPCRGHPGRKHPADGRSLRTPGLAVVIPLLQCASNPKRGWFASAGEVLACKRMAWSVED